MSDSVELFSAESVVMPGFEVGSAGEGGCLTLACGQICLEQTLPDGRPVAEVLPNDGKVREFQGDCPRSTCSSMASFVAVGNVVESAHRTGDCRRPAAVAWRREMNPGA
jgi:hypothetical protein